MFIFTAKLSKKKALLLVVLIAIVISAIILFAGQRDQNPDRSGVPVRSEADILAYLEHLGWQVAPEALEIGEVLIPREFTEAFEIYNNMQIETGFDLRNYSGKGALRYTYRVLNYPGQTEGVIVDVLVIDNHIVGGDIQSIHLDGFMHGLIPRQGT